MTTASPSVTSCPSCQVPLTPGGRYCHRCGRAVGAGSERGIWITAWGTVALCIALIFYFVNHRSAQVTGPDMANAGNAGGAGAAGARPGTPPDISQMTPRERFLRLHDRVMGAAEAGDTATANRFAPMAIAAYGMLDSVDIDARYHAGALYVQAGALPAALALADTIQVEAKGNLLGELLRLEVAQARKDRSGESRARKAFLDHYDAQVALRRPEYEEHKAMLENLRKQLQTQ
jgi:hypothetical protein